MEEIQFKRPELEDKQILDKYFAKIFSRSCERTFASSYLWSRHYAVTYAVIEDTLVFKNGVDHPMFSYPAGEPEAVKRALEFLMEYCKNKDWGFQLYNVTQQEFDQLCGWYPGEFVIEYNRDYADYVYETEKLATLAGKKLHGKRNHINKFKQLYPDWSYESVDKGNIEECFQMALKWRNLNGCDDDPEKNAEMCVTQNYLRLFYELGMKGGILRVNGKIVAFSIGEAVSSDTFVVHIEKAFTDIEGAYPMINQQFVQHECMEYKYVNREEDTGAEGLRKAKLLYRPAFLVEKGTVTKR